jgi:hypothetical protein
MGLLWSDIRHAARKDIGWLAGESGGSGFSCKISKTLGEELRMEESRIRIMVVPAPDEDQWYHADLKKFIVLASEELLGESGFRSLLVPSTTTPNDIIQKELGLPLQSDKQIMLQYPKWFPRAEKAKECTLITRYHLVCPTLPDYPTPKAEKHKTFVVESFEFSKTMALSHSNVKGRRLRADTPIHEQGIIEDMVLALIKNEAVKFDQPEDYPYYKQVRYSEGVRDLRSFDEIIKSRTEEFKHDRFLGPDLFAALLYTDEDAELATYIRLNYAAIDELSGRFCTVFMIERPAEESIAETIAYWKERLAYEMYVKFAVKGRTRTKPYDKAAAYRIAEKLGVFPDQLPCMVFFEQITDKDKLVVPIQDNYTEFFRTLFSSLKKAQSGKKKIQLKEIQAQVMSSSKRLAADQGKDTYNFYGKTVFINHPASTGQLSDFQNDLIEPSDTHDQGGKTA